MTNSDAKTTNDQMTEKCAVREVQITVGVKVSQRYLIYKSENESIDEMFIRLGDESKNSVGKKDCEVCRKLAKWAEKCNGEVCNVVSSYDKITGSFIMDICVNFKQHTDSEKFCNEIRANT